MREDAFGLTRAEIEELECRECGYGNPPDARYVDVRGPQAVDLFCPECNSMTMVRISHGEVL